MALDLSVLQTWSHPWGASPALFLPMGILGIAVEGIGALSVRIRPKLGPLQHASCTVPTVRGPLSVSATPAQVVVHAPNGMRAEVWQRCGSGGRWVGLGGSGRAVVDRDCRGHRAKRQGGGSMRMA